MVMTTTTYPVSVLTMTRAASLSTALLGMAGAVVCPRAAGQRIRPLASANGLGHEAFGYAAKATTQIPTSDVVTDDAPGFRTWSPPV